MREENHIDRPLLFAKLKKNISIFYLTTRARKYKQKIIECLNNWVNWLHSLFSFYDGNMQVVLLLIKSNMVANKTKAKNRLPFSVIFKK